MRRIVIAPTGSQSAVRVEKIDRDARLVSETINGGLTSENLASATKLSVAAAGGAVANAIMDSAAVIPLGGVYSKFGWLENRLHFGHVRGNYRVSALSFVAMNQVFDPQWNGIANLYRYSYSAGVVLVEMVPCVARKVSRDALGITTGATTDVWWFFAQRFYNSLETDGNLFIQFPAQGPRNVSGQLFIQRLSTS
jgi:hypothetical protein